MRTCALNPAEVYSDITKVKCSFVFICTICECAHMCSLNPAAVYPYTTKVKCSFVFICTICECAHMCALNPTAVYSDTTKVKCSWVKTFKIIVGTINRTGRPQRFLWCRQIQHNLVCNWATWNSTHRMNEYPYNYMCNFTCVFVCSSFAVNRYWW